MEPSAEQINQFYDHFILMYDESGKEINPLPQNQKLTIWCESNDGEEAGFAYDVAFNEMGLELFIAKSWIQQDKLDELIRTHGTVDA
jgi:hypothetical protein